METLLTTIFGEKCFFCGRPGRIICYGCESSIKLAKNGVCIVCQQPSVMGFTHRQCNKSALIPSQLCCVYNYDGIVAQIIKKSKYNPKRFALLRLLSASGAKQASKLGFDFTGFTVVPIPISKMREKERGFNQAEFIAKAVAKEFGLATDFSILVRIRDTTKQHGLHKDERAQNIAGAFAVARGSFGQKSSGGESVAGVSGYKGLGGGNFLLVDDICTTGSTLISASSALYCAGAKDVRCLTLSRKL